MKNLSVQSAKELKALVSTFNREVDATKKDLLQKEIIAKFGEDNFNDALAPKKKASKDVKKESVSKDVNSTLLKQINAIGITDAIKAKGGKSIFKKEFNNKADRTKCRNKIQNLMSVYLLHVAHNKKELAESVFADIVNIANTYYSAESTFVSASDYCTDNMDAQKKEIIKLFIENKLDAPKKKVERKKKVKKELDAKELV